MNLETWMSKLYDEEDFGRSVSATLSGVIALSTYILSNDWSLSALILVITFPLFRIVASAIHIRWRTIRDVQKQFRNFSPEEKEVIHAFVESGGAVLSCGRMDRACLPLSGVESLVARGILHHTMLSDLWTEAFVLDTNVFDAAQHTFPRLETSNVVLPF